MFPVVAVARSNVIEHSNTLKKVLNVKKIQTEYKPLMSEDGNAVFSDKSDPMSVEIKAEIKTFKRHKPRVIQP